MEEKWEKDGLKNAWDFEHSNLQSNFPLVFEDAEEDGGEGIKMNELWMG